MDVTLSWLRAVVVLLVMQMPMPEQSKRTAATISSLEGKVYGAEGLVKTRLQQPSEVVESMEMLSSIPLVIQVER
eukprot:1154960-Pelagomonas_calceolata.AAC.3